MCVVAYGAEANGELTWTAKDSVGEYLGTDGFVTFARGCPYRGGTLGLANNCVVPVKSPSTHNARCRVSTDRDLGLVNE